MSKKSYKRAEHRQADTLYLNNIAPRYPNNPNFTYSDAQVLAERLLEQSQQCMFVKPEGPRLACVQRNLSMDCIPKETLAPTSTPNLAFLNREESPQSSIEMKPERIEIARKGRNPSLAQTCSTVAEGMETPYSPIATETTPFLEEGTPSSKLKAELKWAPLPRNHPFSLVPHVHQAKKWTLNVLNDIRASLCRRKTGEGKRPLVELPHGGPTLPPPKPLSRILSDPSGSDQFPLLKEEGGNGPPKMLSAATLDRLDEIEEEQAKLRRECEKLERAKRAILLKNNKGRREMMER